MLVLYVPPVSSCTLEKSPHTCANVISHMIPTVDQQHGSAICQNSLNIPVPSILPTSNKSPGIFCKAPVRSSTVAPAMLRSEIKYVSRADL